MRQWIRSHLTYANVMATLAVFLVLGGGTAMAAYVVSSNSQVGPGTISGHKPPTGDHSNVISGSLNATDLAPGAVTNGKLGNASVTSAKLAQATFHDAGLVEDPNANCSTITDEWASTIGDTVGYYRDLEGRVYLQGLAERCGDPASTQTIMVLPAGFRPSQPNEYFPIYKANNDTDVGLWINSAGLVRAVTSTAGDKLSLNGVSFRCGPSGQNGCP